MPHLLCIGMGYVASRLAVRLRAQGWQVTGTGRTGAEVSYHAGAPPRELSAAVETASHLLISVPPDAHGCPVLRDIAPLWESAAHTPEWIGYLSSSGVYGDHQGGWVDEASRCDQASARFVAESQWLALQAHIFRLAGIYGPHRNALEQVRAGRARRIDAPCIMFSRIHVDDIITVLAASLARPHAGSVYNLADDLPCPASEVVAYACELLGEPPPPLIPVGEADLTPMGRSFYTASKRVLNRKIKEELGVTLQYPSYREGLRGLFETGTPIA